jgi:hypothetical protein
MRSNGLHIGQIQDELQRTTRPFMPADEAFDVIDADDDERDAEQEAIDGQLLDEFLQVLEEEDSKVGQAESTSDNLPTRLSLSPL